MRNLPNIRLHSLATSELPSTGQRRDILMKALRKIQVSPEAGGDFQWSLPKTNTTVEVTVCVGYAISWLTDDDSIRMLDIRSVLA